MQQHLPALRLFIGFWAVTGLAGALFWGWKGTEESFLILHQLRNGWLNLSMPHITHLGDGLLMCGVIGFILARKDPALAITFFLALLITGTIVNVSKQFLFPDMHRPAVIFAGRSDLFLISLGRERLFSFPSGHAAAAVTAAWFGALTGYPQPDISSRKPLWVAVFFALFSAVIAYSRIYIGVHFLRDVLAGAAIGTGVAAVCYRWLYPAYLRGMKRPERSARIWQVLFGLAIPGALIWIWFNYYQ
ncbi:MAG: phosphatase PAP2 family protein [Bacteroidetes bacterium]|nr:MAG: phosphatase PAP2 family protein [Bacteroidota bacterium]